MGKGGYVFKLTSKQLTRHAFRQATWGNMLCSGITFLCVVLLCGKALTFLHCCIHVSVLCCNPIPLHRNLPYLYNS
jgi:hypothetical protein